MNKLEEMQDSCKVFADDLKTGKVEWEKIGGINHFEYDFWARCPLGFLRLWLNEDLSLFYARFAKETPISLKSTTAKEAAHEALQLVMAEAQKLVDALSIETKEPFWTKIEPENYPLIEVFCTNKNEQALGGQIVKNSKGNFKLRKRIRFY